MKKIFYTLAIFSTVALAFASCQKEESEGKIITRFSATAETDAETGAKTFYVEGAFNWQEDDLVTVYDSMNNNTLTHRGVYSITPNVPAYAADLTLTNIDGNGVVEGARVYRAVFPYGVSTSTADIINVPLVQHSLDGQLVNMPMAATYRNDRFFFKNLFGALRIRLQQNDVNVKKIVLTVDNDKKINGYFKITTDVNGIPSVTPTVPSVNHNNVTGTNTSALSCDAAQSIGGEGHVFYIYLPAGSYNTMSLTIYNENGESCTKTAHNISIERSKYTKVTVANNMEFQQANEGALPGLFSVRPDRKVRFSKGNLQYVRPSTTVWGSFQFASSQTEFLGSTPNLNSSSLIFDVFGWGTSGASGTANTWPYNLGGGYNEISNITGTQYDWGLRNPITNGGNTPGMWFTLCSAEWSYLIHCRENAEQKNHIGTVCGVAGLIILPDEFTYPSGCAQLPENVYKTSEDQTTSASTYNDVVYNNDQWALMEQAGAVFLPAAGLRANASVYHHYPFDEVGNPYPIGGYWSSTRWTNLEMVNTNQAKQSANALFFKAGWMVLSEFTHSPNKMGTTDCGNLRTYYWGLSVRLVQDENMVNIMPEYFFRFSGTTGGYGSHCLGH